MNLYEDGRAVEHPSPPGAFRNRMCFLAPGEAAAALPALGFALLDTPAPHEIGIRFEARREYDYLSLQIPDIPSPVPDDYHSVELYVNRDTFAAVCYEGAHAAAALQGEAMSGTWKDTPSPGRLLARFFALLTAGDSAGLEALEDEIDDLEDSILTDRASTGLTADIVAMRKRILFIRRYYEALLAALEDISDNENEFYDDPVLRQFTILTGRAERLHRTVLGLREYITQVREAYQNQLDISLNQTMKLFTVITAIFMPLTLIAGWYGMNLMMPEFQWPYTYYVVIAASVAVVVFCLVFFKKRKWY